MADDLTLIPDQVLIGEQLYAKAVNMILASAQHELLIFDQDLSHGNYSSLQNAELLERFLSHYPNSRLTIVLQHSDFFTEHCPRLVNLLHTFGHKMTIHETNQTVKHAKDCFILADGKNYINRAHIDQARFKYGMNTTASVAALKMRFSELLDATQDVITLTKLGL